MANFQDITDKMRATKKEREWAAKSPLFKEGQPVLAYQDNQPGVIVGPSPKYVGCWLVRTPLGAIVHIAHDNLRLGPE